MHPFGTDSRERAVVLAVLIPVSFTLARIFGWLFGLVNLTIPQEWQFVGDPLSAASCYGALYYLFEHWGWRWKWFRQLGLVKVPDLNGIWDGYLKSSWNNYTTPFDATILIEQT